MRAQAPRSLQRRLLGQMVIGVEKLVRREQRIGIVADDGHVEAGKAILDRLGRLPGGRAMIFGLVAEVWIGGQDPNMAGPGPSGKGLYESEGLRVFL